MERRKFLIGAGSAAVGSSALIGSGAFTSVEADRDISVAVKADDNAYLALEALEEQYASGSGDGVIEFHFNEAEDGSASGLNMNAVTTIEDVFAIHNQGPNDVEVSIPVGEGDYKSESTKVLVDETDITAGNTVEINSGNTKTASFEFDVDRESGSSDYGPVSMTIKAEEV